MEPESLYSEERLDSELTIAIKTPRRERPSHREPEKVSPHYSEDSTDSELSTPVRTPRLDEPRNHPSEIAAVWFSSHLSKLDSQLAALQNIADCLEKDLPQSRIPKKVIFSLVYSSYSDFSNGNVVTFYVCVAVQATASLPSLTSEREARSTKNSETVSPSGRAQNAAETHSHQCEKAHHRNQ